MNADLKLVQNNPTPKTNKELLVILAIVASLFALVALCCIEFWPGKSVITSIEGE